MRPQFVFLAGPIDRAGSSTTLGEWRRLAAAGAKSNGWVMYDPSGAFSVGLDASPDVRLEAVNRAALERADVLLALLPAGLSTIGTAMEIEWAHRCGKPVVVVGGSWSWSLASMEDIVHAATMPEALEEVSRLLATDLGADGGGRLTLAVKRLAEGGSLPYQRFDGDAGLDLFVSEEVTVPVGQFRDVACGIAVELPAGTWGLIVGRSSTLRKRGLIVYPGVIDNGYRGPLFTGVQNVGDEGQKIEVGERLGQLIPLPLEAAKYAPRWVDTLSDSDRGEHGFGSSGR